MSEVFWDKWGRYLFNWYGFVFTVLGTVIALGLAREHWWISVLVVVAAFAASGSFAYHIFRESGNKEEQHKAELQRLADENRAIQQRLDETERKLNEVPVGILQQLVAALAEYSSDKLAKLLITHAELAGRMKQFSEANAKPINLRTFSRQGDDLFALAKAAAPALLHLRVGDPFLLMRKGVAGVETASAHLVIHQPPDQTKEVVAFRISSFLSDELGHIDSLARSSDVNGIKGYSIKPASDPDRYLNIDCQNLAVAIGRLVQDLDQIWRT